MKSNVLAFLVVGVVMAACGGGGGGGSGTTGGGSCSEVIPVDRLCELSCTSGSRTTEAQVRTLLNVPASIITGPLKVAEVEYQVFGYQCDDVGTADSYNYLFYFLSDGLAHIDTSGTGKFASGGSDSRAQLPVCAAACNAYPAGDPMGGVSQP